MSVLTTMQLLCKLPMAAIRSKTTKAGRIIEPAVIVEDAIIGTGAIVYAGSLIGKGVLIADTASGARGLDNRRFHNYRP